MNAGFGIPAFNHRAVWAIYRFELARFGRTLWSSLGTPVITTSLYFVVFGAAIGSRMGTVGGVTYGAFIVPGLIMLSLFTESISNASFGIHFPRWTGSRSTKCCRRRCRRSRRCWPTSALRRPSQ